jgi:putative glycosyltransferase (TIGR04372 family)
LTPGLPAGAGALPLSTWPDSRYARARTMSDHPPARYPNYSDIPDQAFEELCTYIEERTRLYWDGRPRVFLVIGLVSYVGHAFFDVHALKSLYDPNVHQLFVVHPQMVQDPNPPAYEILLRDTVRIPVAPPYGDLVFKMGAAIFRGGCVLQRPQAIVLFSGHTMGIAGLYHRLMLERGPNRATISLDEQELDYARRILRQLRIEENARIAVLHVREQGYNAAAAFNSWRNSDPRDYLPAIRYLQSSGFIVVRIGDRHMAPLSELGVTGLGDTVFDAPFHPHYDPVWDMVFCSRCAFFINSSSGPQDIARAFGKPNLWTNAVMSNFASPEPEDMLLPRRYLERSTKRALALAELLNRDCASITTPQHIEELGVVPAALDAETITEACKEMIAAQGGTVASEGYERICAAEHANRVRYHQARPELPASLARFFCYAPGSRLSAAYLDAVPGFLAGELAAWDDSRFRLWL